jgi:hypothetical protein
LWSLVLLLLGILAVGKSFGSSSSPSEYDKLRLMQIDEEYQMWKWIDDRTRHGEDFDRLSGSRRQLDTRSNDVFKGYNHQDVKEALRIAQYRLDLIRARIMIDEDETEYRPQVFRD